MATNNAINRGTNQFLTRTNLITYSAGSFTYTPSAGTVNVLVEIVGGGGSGGGVSGGTVSQLSAASGGGGGGYCKNQYTISQIGASAAVVVGAGGAATAAGFNNGNSGGNSTFTPAGAGAVLSALGGAPGTGQAQSLSSQVSTPGMAATASGGLINVDGLGTSGGYTSSVGIIACSSKGGDSQLGLGGKPHSFVVSGTGNTGIAGKGFGAGSSGAAQIALGNFGADAGRDGICIITEYIS